MEFARNFDGQNYDESMVDYRSTYIKETFRQRKVSMENFDKSPIIRQICQTFHHQIFALAIAIGYIICRVDNYIKTLLLATAIHA